MRRGIDLAAARGVGLFDGTAKAGATAGFTVARDGTLIVAAPATPMTRLRLETRPSFAPSTAARSALPPPARWRPSNCATAAPDYMRRWFAQGVNAASLALAPSLVFDHNDRLQERWVRRAGRKDVPLVAHRLPSTQAFVDACLAGLGWGMNPLHLVQAHLQSGSLVELVPDRPLDVPLYWQCATLPLPTLEHLGQCVQRAAALSLVR
jgi:hypothetical protein